jgi:hypothetical protein
MQTPPFIGLVQVSVLAIDTFAKQSPLGRAVKKQNVAVPDSSFSGGRTFEAPSPTLPPLVPRGEREKNFGAFYPTRHRQASAFT